MKKRLPIIVLWCASLAISSCRWEVSEHKRKASARSLFPGVSCPVPGRAAAMEIRSEGPIMEGPDALGGEGDYLLMNEKAAFIVQGLTRKTYYYYGGIPIDAVALDGCTQAHPEQFEELGLFIGQLDQANPLNSGLRAFHGQSVEIVNDGSDGGEAVVRVHGVDDIFWIVELELIRAAWREFGIAKPITPPFGIDVYVDYILPPDSPVLRIEINLVNKENSQKSFMTGAAAFFGDSTRLKYYSDFELSLLNYDLDAGVPFLAASSGTGSWVFAMKDAVMGTTYISGIQAMADANQLSSPTVLEPAGQPGDSATITYYFGVAAADFNSGIREMHEENPHPLPGWTVELKNLDGYAYDIYTGEPLTGVELEVQVKNADSVWTFIDGFESDDTGWFGGEVPDLGKEYRLVAHLEGRPDPNPAYFHISEVDFIEVGFMPSGTLLYDIRDEAGRNIPAKILLWQGGKQVKRISAIYGEGTVELPPGDYEVSITRGYEYTTYQGSLQIKPLEVTPLQVNLVHAVDTTGFMSFDGHMHAGPSGDNYISIEDRIATVVAEGLEVAISTDHEFVADWSPAIEELGLEEWVATVVGQEVTATSPEHINMFGVEPDPDDPRGGFVKWYGMDIEQIFDAIRDRGAQIIQLNHPRNGCNYMCLIGYDRLTGTATGDPAQVGLPPGATLWSWNFDAVEYMNGNDSVFIEPGKENETGTFDDWMSFLNLGHRITAHSNTDVHNWGTPGSPRNYFASSTDNPAEFNPEDLFNAIKQGKVLPSSGAFARIRAFDPQDGDSAGMGDTMTIQGNTVDLWLHIEAIPEIDVTHFKVFVNCDQVMDLATTAPDEVVKFDGTIQVPISRDSHLVVLGFGDNYLPRGFRQFNPVGVPRFTTNAIYIDQDGNGQFDPPGGKTCSYTVP